MPPAKKTWVNLNMTEKYAPTFSEMDNWPVAREILCNALDSAPGNFLVHSDRNLLIVSTKTAPTLEQVLVIGEGTKTPGGQTIGQFGEGLKVAANAVCRGAGRMIVELPEHTISYAYRIPKGYTVPTLHACVEQKVNEPGCKIRVELSNVGTHADKILTNQKPHLIPRDEKEPKLRLYNKGVWVNDLDERSLFHYNLSVANINRDRGVVDMHSVKHYAGFYLILYMNPELAEKLLTLKDECKFEHDVLSYTAIHASERSRKIMSDAFVKLHGALAVVAGDNEEKNRKATFIGHKAIKVPRDFECHLIGLGSPIKRVEDVLPEHSDLTFVDMDPAWTYKIKKLESLADTLGVPGFGFRVFEDSRTVGKTLGIYIRTKEGTSQVGLNKELFEDGRERELYGTFCHECTHAKEFTPTDGTFEFEASLTRMCGHLAEIILDGDVQKEVVS